MKSRNRSLSKDFTFDQGAHISIKRAAGAVSTPAPVQKKEKKKKKAIGLNDLEWWSRSEATAGWHAACMFLARRRRRRTERRPDLRQLEVGSEG